MIGMSDLNCDDSLGTVFSHYICTGPGGGRDNLAR